MELLIPGLLLVGLMVYASTRIKRLAAKALEPETIETDQFSIMKPDGLISVVAPDNGLLFDAHTREFADEPADGFRKAAATVRMRENEDFDRFSTALVNSGGHVKDDVSSKVGEMRTRSIEIIDSENGVSISRFHKLVQNKEKLFDLQIEIPADHREQFDPALRQMADSFLVKD
ncbi:MAG: hypothetical protein ACR2IH_01460 [Pyrinomonadaceae bacterium]